MKNKLKDNLFSAAVTAAVITAVVLVNIVLYSLTQINGWYKIYSSNLDSTISGNTDLLFEEAIAEGRHVDIIFCMPEDELAVHTTGKDVLDTAKQFEERYPSLVKLKFYNVRTMQDADGNIVDFTKYQTDGMGSEVTLHKGSVIFSSKVTDAAGLEREDFKVLGNMYGGTAFVDFYHIDSEGYITAYNGEEIIASMILWALASEHKIAYFTTRHGESVDLTFANMLTCAGYYIEMLDLVRTDLYRSGGTADPSKKGLDLDRAGLVIISNPTADFAKGTDGVRTELNKLEDYLKEGGSLYVSLDPYAGSFPNLESLLASYGITVSVSEDSTGKTVKNIVKDSKNAITTDGYTFVANYAESDFGTRLAAKTDRFVPGDVIVKDAGELLLSGGAQPVLMSSSSSVTVADGKRVDGDGSYCVAAVSEKTYGEKTSRMLVISGVYLTSSDAVISDAYANRNFTYAVLDVCFDSPSAPYGCRLVPYNTEYLENMTMGRARAYTVLIMAVPVAMVIVGIAVNKRRKNR